MGKERCLQALRREKTDRTPWILLPGAYGGKASGCGAEAALRDADQMAAAFLACRERYAPDGMAVLYDTTVEAECLGCDLTWSGDGLPAVANHPLADTDEMLCRCMLPSEYDGRLPVILPAMQRIKEEAGADTALIAPICGPFTMAYQLRGERLLTEDLAGSPGYMQEILNYCAEAAFNMLGLYIGAGMDVIALADPVLHRVPAERMGPLLADDYRAIFDLIRARGALSGLLAPGVSAAQLEALCNVGADWVSVGSALPAAEALAVTEKYPVCLGTGLGQEMLCSGDAAAAAEKVRGLRTALEGHPAVLCGGEAVPYAAEEETVLAAARAACL